MTIQKIKSGRVLGIDSRTYVGNHGQIFYNESLGDLRLSDGETPGGIPLQFGSSTGTSTASSVTVVDSVAPASATTGTLWFDTVGGRIYVYYDSAWIDASPDAGYTLPTATTSTIGGVRVGSGLNIALDGTISGPVSSSTAPVNPRESTLWYDTTGGRLYVYYDNSWVDSNPQNSYVLNTATSTVLGGVKIGQGLLITGDGTLSSSGLANLDGGYPFSVYGGIEAIDAGGI
jgi:hypothetical protein